jgi:hypothetical protein
MLLQVRRRPRDHLGMAAPYPPSINRQLITIVFFGATDRSTDSSLSKGEKQHKLYKGVACLD